MKKFFFLRIFILPVIFALFSMQIFSQNAWINEFHYDNVSTDVGEFIEVVIQDAGNYSLSEFKVVLYNGSSSVRAPYDEKTLDQFSPGETVGAFTTFCYDFPSNGIQNGAPDGLCLTYGTDTEIVLQFISYEGSFEALSGPAATMTSVDIGVAETSSTPVGYSLQLQGEGSAYADFTWASEMEDTNCTVNTGQTLVSPVTTPISDWAIVIGILLITLFAFFRIRRNG
jgi:hypothetical protein